jgi:hypothetical protein
MHRRALGFQPKVEELPSRVTPSVGWFLGGEWQPDFEGGPTDGGGCGQEPPAAGWSGEENVCQLPAENWEGDTDWLTWPGLGDFGSPGNGEDRGEYSAGLWTITSFGNGEADWTGEIINLPIDDDASWWNWWEDGDHWLDIVPSPGGDVDWIVGNHGDFPVDEVLPIKDVGTSPDFLADSDSATDLIYLASQTGGRPPLTLAGRALESALSAYWTVVDRTTVLTNLPAALPTVPSHISEPGLQWQREPAAQPSDEVLIAPFRRATESASTGAATDQQTPTAAVLSALTGQGSLARPFGKFPAEV